jgi:hypothetical protein
MYYGLISGHLWKSQLFFLLLFSGDEVFQVNGIAGSGAYAKVFSANKVDLVPVNAGAIALKVCYDLLAVVVVCC